MKNQKKIRKVYDFNLKEASLAEKDFYKRDNNILIFTQDGKPVYNK